MLDANGPNAHARDTQTEFAFGLVIRWRILQSALVDPKLSPSTVIVMARMLDYANGKTGACFPKHETLAVELGVGDRSVRRAVHEMKKGGYIAVEQRYRKAALYQFLTPQDRPNLSGLTPQDRPEMSGQTGQICPVRPAKNVRALTCLTEPEELNQRESVGADAPMHAHSHEKGCAQKERGGETESDHHDHSGRQEKNCAAARRRPLPVDWSPGPEGTKYAAAQGYDEARAVDMCSAFCDYYTGHGQRRADWDATWRSWVLREKKIDMRNRVQNAQLRQYQRNAEKDDDEHWDTVTKKPKGRRGIDYL